MSTSSDVVRLRDRLKTWATEAAYPLWWTSGADHAKGGFFEKLDMDGQPTDGARRGRVLPRQIFSFSLAGELGWAGPWREPGTTFVEGPAPASSFCHIALAVAELHRACEAANEGSASPTSFGQCAPAQSIEI